MAVRLCNLIKAEPDMEIRKTTFWTDSTTVLQYTYNELGDFIDLSQYALRKYMNILSLNSGNMFRGNLTHEADDGSRDLCIEALSPTCRWWCGPHFLY